MPSRRDYLAGLSLIWISGVAGCTALSDSEPLSQVELDNNTDEDIETLVEVTDEADETIFRQSFMIEAGDQEEDTEWFDGEPARISVVVDDAEPLTAEWPSQITEVRAGERPERLGESLCVQGGDSVTGVFVRISSTELVRLEPTCGDPQ
ncbi:MULTISPECIES: hypothetical protein [Salinibaculum]|uniref:hypothetical protein n=1 Tax=Salinibaculum TaxID=2732368 RepID=UPI0030D1C674